MNSEIGSDRLYMATDRDFNALSSPAQNIKIRGMRFVNSDRICVSEDAKIEARTQVIKSAKLVDNLELHIEVYIEKLLNT